jgi:hypothetical protein
MPKVIRAKARRIRRMHPHAAAPRAGDVDAVSMAIEGELRTDEQRLHTAQARHQRIQRRHDQPRHAAQHLRRPGRQMKLAATDIDPGVVNAGAQVRVTRQAQAHHVKNNGLLLVRHAQVDMTEFDDVADVLGAAVEAWLFGGGAGGWGGVHGVFLKFGRWPNSGTSALPRRRLPEQEKKTAFNACLACHSSEGGNSESSRWRWRSDPTLDSRLCGNDGLCTAPGWRFCLISNQETLLK